MSRGGSTGSEPSQQRSTQALEVMLDPARSRRAAARRPDTVWWVLTRHDLRSLDQSYQDALPRPLGETGAHLAAVRQIIGEVQRRGDEALCELGERFDGSRPDPLRIIAQNLAAAVTRVDPHVVASLRAAAESIESFHRSAGNPAHAHEHRGMRVEAVSQPVDRAGCYVPGGRAAYPSTVLMTVVPARAAQVPEVVVCVPPGADGKVADVTLAAASIAGVDELYAVGGAQAIAAMAYGTETIRPVDVIVGPGNVYVSLAKREVAGVVGVPSAFAGPSEICVVADGSVDPRYVAIDLLVQAEHGPDGLSWLIVVDDHVLAAVESAMADLLQRAPRRSEIESTLASGGHVALVRDWTQAIDVANWIAPEHLQLMTKNAAELVGRVRHAGAVFVGPLAPAVMGDYIAGPSHVLPTNGSARFAGALGIQDFTKQIHVVSLDEAAMRWAGPHVEALATAEGLDAHAESVRLRLRDFP